MILIRHSTAGTYVKTAVLKHLLCRCIAVACKVRHRYHSVRLAFAHIDDDFCDRRHGRACKRHLVCYCVTFAHYTIAEACLGKLVGNLRFCKTCKLRHVCVLRLQFFFCIDWLNLQIGESFFNYSSYDRSRLHTTRDRVGLWLVEDYDYCDFRVIDRCDSHEGGDIFKLTRLCLLQLLFGSTSLSAYAEARDVCILTCTVGNNALENLHDCL